MEGKTCDICKRAILILENEKEKKKKKNKQYYFKIFIGRTLRYDVI